jgi:hypothetical protein
MIIKNLTYTLVVTITFILLIVQCKNSHTNTNKNNSITINNKDKSYDIITIETDHQKIIIPNQDSCYIYYYEYENEGGFEADIICTKDTTFLLSKSERDLIYNLIDSIFMQSPRVKRKVTCYVGNLKITIDKDYAQYSCSFESIGQWKNLNSHTNKIYNILNSKIKLEDY